MSIRSTIVLTTLLLSPFILTGCSSEFGEKMRTDAYNRVDLFNAQLHLEQAKQAFEVGKLKKAEDQIKMAIQLGPDQWKYRVLQGRVYLETHRLEMALGAFDQAIEINQAEVDQLIENGIEDAALDAEPHYFRGIVFQRWSNDEEAYEAYNTAMELDDDNVQYVLATAETLVAMDELDEAETLIESKLVSFEYNAALQQLYGQIAMLGGDAETAASRLTQARMLRPGDLPLLDELVRARYEAGDYGGCIDAVQEYFAAGGPERTDLRLLHARCLALLDRTQESRNLYLEISRNDPNDANVWIELGTIGWELGNFKRVAQCATRAIALAPDRFEGYLLKGAHAKHNGRIDEAIELFETACSMDPQATMPLIALGLAYETAGDPQAAMASYDQVITLDPGNREATMLRERLDRITRVSAAPSDR